MYQTGQRHFTEYRLRREALQKCRVTATVTVEAKVTFTPVDLFEEWLLADGEENFSEWHERRTREQAAKLVEDEREAHEMDMEYNLQRHERRMAKTRRLRMQQSSPQQLIRDAAMSYALQQQQYVAEQLRRQHARLDERRGQLQNLMYDAWLGTYSASHD